MFAKIHLSINVIEVLDLNEVDSAMVLQYRMTLRWRDSRVKFRNLKKENFLNTVGTSDAEKIWYPQVVFYNTRDMEETKVNMLTKKGLMVIFLCFFYSTMTSLSSPFSAMAVPLLAHFKRYRMITYTRELKMTSSSRKSTKPVSPASMTWPTILSTYRSAAWFSLCRQDTFKKVQIEM